jgi:PEGA domain
MKKTSSMLAVVLPLMLVAAAAFAQTDEQPRHPPPPKSSQPPHAQSPKPAPPPQAQHRPPDRPRGTTGVVPPTRPRPPIAVPRYRVYPEPNWYPYMHPHVPVPVIVYAHPHFWFRPWLWLGFGVYLGYPVSYPLDYGVPTYAYGDGMVYPAPVLYGGIAFSIVPDDASVIVDGSYVGNARDFGPTCQPLTLTPGRHHVELEVPGMAPLAFDVDIIAGQVIPYSGRLQPK